MGTLRRIFLLNYNEERQPSEIVVVEYLISGEWSGVLPVCQPGEVLVAGY